MRTGTIVEGLLCNTKLGNVGCGFRWLVANMFVRCSYVIVEMRALPICLTNIAPTYLPKVWVYQNAKLIMSNMKLRTIFLQVAPGCSTQICRRN